ncbi:MAG: hypothetical protein GF311_00570 [Candidatus Lokiarchaeota archaeon]|nr:hypothetical protein [Candidatus Lokiarchaeota archaeon]
MGFKFGMISILGLREFNPNRYFANLFKQKPKKPNYLNNKDEISIFKHLTLKFLWYNNFEIVEKTKVFNGYLAFRFILYGAVEYKRRNNLNEKVKVIRFIHPYGSGRNDYSYAILIEASSFNDIVDYNGWLVFFSCFNDHSGTDIQYFRRIESELQIFEEVSLIEVTELKISSSMFIKYFTGGHSKEIEKRDKNEPFIIEEIKNTFKGFFQSKKKFLIVSI